MTFGEKLRQIRKQKGLTQPQAAQGMGISLRTYKAYELNQSNPQNETFVQRIADFYEVSTSTVEGWMTPVVSQEIGRKNPTRTRTNTAPQDLDSTTEDLIRQLGALLKSSQQTLARKRRWVRSLLSACPEIGHLEVDGGMNPKEAVHPKTISSIEERIQGKEANTTSSDSLAIFSLATDSAPSTTTPEAYATVDSVSCGKKQKDKSKKKGKDKKKKKKKE